MESKNRLRRQLIAERRKKNIFFVLVFLLSALFVSFNLFLDDMGIIKYMTLKGEEELLNQKIVRLEGNINSLRDEIKDIHTDPFYIEKQAREDLGLAKPDEYIYRIE